MALRRRYHLAGFSAYTNSVDHPKRRRGRPPTEAGTLPTRSMRIGPIFDKARAIADAKGESITAVVTRLLEAYVAEQEPGGD